MFKDKTAWFSNSVRRDIAKFWVFQGGLLSDWKTADYLFSSDAECSDTKRIHLSDEYVKNRATVFHSAYLSTCRQRQSTKFVPLGHYLLPPVCVQKEVKAKIGRFIWEQDELMGETHGNSTEQMLHGDTDDGGRPTKKGKYRHDNCMSTYPSRNESVCCEAQLYPVNNMVSGYVHIDQLRKYTGELHDFLPSHFGCSITRPHSRKFPDL